jgi:predicted transcriptional regulator
MSRSKRSGNLSIEQKELVFSLFEQGVTQQQIANSMGVSVSCVKVHLHRKRVADSMPPKVKVVKRITDGRVGQKIKKIVQESPKTPYRDVRSHLQGDE